MFNVGSSLFWGVFESGKHPGRTEDWWFNNIRNDWHNIQNTENGAPVWKQEITYPGVGLE
jgi:hypothetical protein